MPNVVLRPDGDYRQVRDTPNAELADTPSNRRAPWCNCYMSTTTVPDTQPMMTVPAVAEYLGVHPRTVLRYLLEGKIRAYRIAGATRIKREDLDAALAVWTPDNRQGHPRN